MKILKLMFIKRLCLCGGYIVLLTKVNAGIPSVMRVIPNSGPLNGGNTVLIKGSNFDKNIIVKFGDRQCSAIKFLESEPDVFITWVPTDLIPITELNVYVTVTNSEGTSSKNINNRYRYLPPKKLSKKKSGKKDL